jgi:hypothetical protein
MLRITGVIAILLAAVVSFPAAAQIVEMEGVAPITDSAPGKARVLAIQNAIRLAALQHSAQISSTTLMSNHIVTGDSARVRSNARVTNVAVVDEWTDENNYHVLIRASVHSGGETEAGGGVRKKVAFLQFQLRDRAAASDLPGLEIELPRMLRKEMETRYRISGVDAAQYAVTEPGTSAYSAFESLERTRVVNIAQALGAQFLVGGTIVDTGISADTLGQSRRLELELYLFDGISGTLMARSRFDDRVVAAERVKPGVSVVSREFLNTPYGTAISRMLRQGGVTIDQEMSRLPLSARVVRSVGKRVYLDAGAVSALRVGDILLAYRVDGSPLLNPQNGQMLGLPELPVATLVIRNVQPQFSVGELETEQVTLKPGDVLRFGW